MPGPELPALELTGEERLGLETLVRRHTVGQQLALRGRGILAAAEGMNRSTIAARLGTTINTVRHWRRLWVRVRITADRVCRVVALAYEAPAESERPIGQWTGREVAAEVMQRGIVERISPRHAARILKIGRPQAASGPLLADSGAR